MDETVLKNRSEGRCVYEYYIKYVFNYMYYDTSSVLKYMQ